MGGVKYRWGKKGWSILVWGIIGGTKYSLSLFGSGSWIVWQNN